MFIGIDWGSSFLKLACFEPEEESVFNVVRVAVKPCLGTDPRQHMYDTAQGLALIRRYIDECTDCGKAVVEGILLSTQMHGFLLENTVTGQVTPYISWQDERCLAPYPGEQTCLSHLRRRIPPELMRGSGVRLKCELACANLFAMKYQEGIPSLKGYRFYTLGSYVIRQLCGEYVTHVTNAAPTGMYDLEKQQWNAPLLDCLGFDGLALPRVTRQTAPCGYYRNIPVYPDFGDQQICLLGAGCGTGDIQINIGTASQMSRRYQIFSAPGETDCFETRPFLFGDYLRTVSKLPGGRSIQLLIDFLRETAQTLTGQAVTEEQAWEKIDSLALMDAPELVVKTGFFNTLLFSRGCIDHIRPETLGLRQLISGAYYDMAESFAKILPILDPERSCASVLLVGRMGRSVKQYLEGMPQARGYRFVMSREQEAVFSGFKKLIRSVRGKET